MKKCLLCIEKGYGETFSCFPGELYFNYELREYLIGRDTPSLHDRMYIVKKGETISTFYTKRFIEITYNKYIKLLCE